MAEAEIIESPCLSILPLSFMVRAATQTKARAEAEVITLSVWGNRNSCAFSAQAMVGQAQAVCRVVGG